MFSLFIIFFCFVFFFSWKGLSEEIKLANRERDYAYALECTADKDLGFIEKTIKEKLRERTKTGE